MARMKIISLSRWGDGGIQVSFELVNAVEGESTNHTEMAMPVSSAEFSRLMAMKLYDEFDIDGKKIISTSALTT